MITLATDGFNWAIYVNGRYAKHVDPETAMFMLNLLGVGYNQVDTPDFPDELP